MLLYYDTILNVTGETHKKKQVKNRILKTLMIRTNANEISRIIALIQGKPIKDKMKQQDRTKTS